MTAVAGGGCHGNLEMIGSAVHWQEARWGRGMERERGLGAMFAGEEGSTGWVLNFGVCVCVGVLGGVSHP